MVRIMKSQRGRLRNLIVARDVEQARRKAELRGEMDLALALWRMPYPPPRTGLFVLPGGEMLVIDR